MELEEEYLMCGTCIIYLLPVEIKAIKAAFVSQQSAGVTNDPPGPAGPQLAPQISRIIAACSAAKEKTQTFRICCWSGRLSSRAAVHSSERHLMEQTFQPRERFVGLCLPLYLTGVETGCSSRPNPMKNEEESGPERRICCTLWRRRL